MPQSGMIVSFAYCMNMEGAIMASYIKPGGNSAGPVLGKHGKSTANNAAGFRNRGNFAAETIVFDTPAARTQYLNNAGVSTHPGANAVTNDVAWRAFALRLKVSTGRYTADEYRQYLEILDNGSKATRAVHSAIAEAFGMEDEVQRAFVVSDAILSPRGQERLWQVSKSAKWLVEDMNNREREYFLRQAYIKEKTSAGREL